MYKAEKSVDTINKKYFRNRIRRILYEKNGLWYRLILAFLFLGAGFFLSYQVADLRKEMSKLQENSAQERQQVSTLVSSKDQELVFENL